MDIRVSNPIGQCVTVNKICRKCPLKIRGHEFSIDMMLLSFDEFDVILWMDWLTMNDAMVNCKDKRITLQCLDGDLLSVETERLDCTTSLISALNAQKLIHKVVRLF